MDQLTRDSIAAQKAGMSYGKWKALHYRPEVIPVAVVEPEPVVVPEVKQTPERICAICGEKLPRGRRSDAKYCSPFCHAEANRRCAYAYYHRKKGRKTDGKV